MRGRIFFLHLLLQHLALPKDMILQTFKVVEDGKPLLSATETHMQVNVSEHHSFSADHYEFVCHPV